MDTQPPTTSPPPEDSKTHPNSEQTGRVEKAPDKKTFPKALAIIAGVIVLFVIFAAGVFIGVEKTRFSYSWDENYYKNFAEPKPQGPFLDRSYMNPNGVLGQIIKISGDILTLKDDDNMEKNVVATAVTTIRKGPEDISPADLKINDYIIVIGAPDNQGQLEAKLIRVLPSAPPNF